MHEFWYFGFITAKHWGHGPTHWTVHDLWQNFHNAVSPGLLAPTPPAHLSSLDAQSPGSRRHTNIQDLLPPPLCRWSIHISMDDNIEWLDEDAQEVSADTSTQAWPRELISEPFEQKLQDGLESNSFSTVETTQLPFDLGYVSQAARKSQQELWKEGLGFAIMGRNFELLERLMKDTKESKIQGIYPAHLAATYLDGGKTCCRIMRLLLRRPDKFDREVFKQDSKGYTIFDVLMLRILRSHSSTPLEVVNDNLRGAQGYAGEEVDICGRWDAESDTYRKLIGSGALKVPLSWKHKFCHTSIQAICHCIYDLSWPFPAPSGLFRRRCFSCGLLLELQPLHAMVLTALQLLRNAMDGEDLFGMICCLFQWVITNNENLLDISKSHISTHILQEDMDHDGCAHEELYPSELAMRADSIAQHYGSPEARKGWAAFVLILRQIEEQYRWVSEMHPPPGYEEEHEAILEEYRHGGISDYGPNLKDLLTEDIFLGSLEFPIECDHESGSAFGRNTCLGHIWAACQAELLTYRRQQESHLWLSQYFTIDAVLECLRTGDPGVLPHVKNGMLKPYCACGVYRRNMESPQREHACTSYFSNLDDWHRTSFLPPLEY